MASKQSVFRSFANAFKGIYSAFAAHRNLQIMLICALITIGIGVYADLFRYEWAMVITSISLVIGLEMINTSLEEVLDHLHPERHENVGRAKDIAAGAVLIASIGSAIVGLYIFIPKFM